MRTRERATSWSSAMWSVLAVLALVSCAQRLNVGSRADGAADDGGSEAALEDGATTGDAAGEGGVGSDAGSNAAVDADVGDCPPPRLLGSMVKVAGTAMETKLMRYSMKTRTRCEDLLIPRDDGIYAALQTTEGLFVLRERTVEQLNEETGTTLWSVNVGNEFGTSISARGLFRIDDENGNPSIAVSLVSNLSSYMYALLVLDPATGDERTRVVTPDFVPTQVTGYAAHSGGGARFLAQRNNSFGLADMVLDGETATAQKPYLLDTDIYSKGLRSFAHGDETTVVWLVTDGIRYWRGSELKAPISNPRGPAMCTNLDCDIKDAVADPSDPNIFYLACQDVVRMNAFTGECEVAVSRDDDGYYALRALELSL